jgi:hypothetical protein
LPARRQAAHPRPCPAGPLCPLAQVDLSTFDPNALEGLGVLSDQVALADVLVGSKADLVPGGAGGGGSGAEGGGGRGSGGPGALAVDAAAAALAGLAAPSVDEGAAGAAGGDAGDSGGVSGSGDPSSSGASPVARFERWARGLYPPKADVQVISGGRLDCALLDRPRSNAYASLVAGWRAPGGSGGARGRRRPAGDAGAGSSSGALGGGVDGDGRGDDGAAAAAAAAPALAPALHAPARVARPAGGGPPACGWVFHAADSFDRARLTALLAALQRARGVARAKGVFRVGAADFVLPGLALGARGRPEVALAPICYRGESCAEVILGDGPGGATSGGSGSAMGAAAPAAGPDEAAGPSDAAVASAVAAAAAGNWAPMEALWLAALA